VSGFSTDRISGWRRRSKTSGFASWATLPPRSTDIFVEQETGRDDPPAPQVAWEGYLRKINEE